MTCPLLGHLFRETTRRKTKTNLLLFLTPYIIRDQSDFRRIFERKMAERQQFVEQFYGQVTGYDVPVDFSRKTVRWRRMRRVLATEEQKVENGGPGQPGERVLDRPGGSGAAGSSQPRSGHRGSLSGPAAVLRLHREEPVPVQPPPAPPPEEQERLRIQPDTGDER